MRKTIALLMALAPGVVSAQEPEKKGSERWEESIAKFESEAAKDPPPKNAILFVGSSSIRMWKLDESFPKRKTINRGFGGSTLADSIHFFDRLIVPHEPRAIVIYAGDNDVHKGLDANGVLADFKKLADLIEEKLPGTPAIFIAIKPSTKRWELWPVMKDANDRIANYCDGKEHLYFADIAKPMLEGAEGAPDETFFAMDGLHLSPKGYASWKAVIGPLLKKALAGK